MVEAMKDVFEQIYSIELSRDLYEKAMKRFTGVTHIRLIRGDSGKELGRVVNEIDRPALFWLDGHYSAGVAAKGEKDTPFTKNWAIYLARWTGDMSSSSVTPENLDQTPAIQR
jgi:hypothetical protein